MHNFPFEAWFPKVVRFVQMFNLSAHLSPSNKQIPTALKPSNSNIKGENLFPIINAGWEDHEHWIINNKHGEAISNFDL